MSYTAIAIVLTHHSRQNSSNLTSSSIIPFWLSYVYAGGNTDIDNNLNINGFGINCSYPTSYIALGY